MTTPRQEGVRNLSTDYLNTIMLEYEPAAPSPVVVIEQQHYNIPDPRWDLNIMTDEPSVGGSPVVARDKQTQSRHRRVVQAVARQLR